MLISHSILDCDFLNLEKEIRRLIDAKVDFIHVDLMDGHFVPNISMGLRVIKDIKKICDIPLDVHLMFDYPLFFIDKIDEYLEGDKRSIITIHEECKSNVSETLEKIERLGYKKGLSLKAKTPIERAKKYIDELDLFLQMTIVAGFGGQKIIVDAIKNIEELKGQDLIISADGGITDENVDLLKEAGCNMIVLGSYGWKSNDIGKTVKKMKGE